MLLPPVNDLPEIIRQEMEASGAMTFARFMELALYCPHFGYYEQLANTPGRCGDFYTSVSVGSLFGELLATQFGHWLAQLEAQGLERPSQEPAPDRLQLLEAGAQDGRLAADILAWFRSRRPLLFAKLDYWILEPSPSRQRWQKNTLTPFNGHVFWFGSWEELPPTGVRGIIFANELLDAMPVHRLGWDAERKTWLEWGVRAEGGQFVWQKLPLSRERGHPLATPEWRAQRSASRLADWLAALEAVLPDGFTTELSSAAVDWWRGAAAALQRGWLLTLDYGLTAEQLLSPERAQGTLRAYSRHRMGADLLANPGAQDLTAHVNLTALQYEGEAAGLKTEGVVAQGEFLTRIAEAGWSDPDGLGEWTPARKRQFQTLTHPEYFGHQFKLLIQTR